MNTPQVVILRGLPGSGKSRTAREQYPGAVVVSADHFFEKGGSYVFDAAKIGEAHAECLRAYVDLLQHAPRSPGVMLVVDNTNIAAWEIAPYYSLAAAFVFDVKIVTIRVDPGVAWRRQTHAVPPHVFDGMVERLASEILPVFWVQG